MRHFVRLLIFLAAPVFAQGFSSVVGPGPIGDPVQGDPAILVNPQSLDLSFQFGETNVTEIRDIELFPDGSIAYGGVGSYETIGVAGEDGSVPERNFGGMSLTETRSVAVDAADRAVFGGGLQRFEFGYPHTRVVNEGDDHSWIFENTLNGVINKVILQPNRKVIAAGKISIPGDTNNFYGLVRLKRAGGIDTTFAYTNSAGIEVTAAAATADGRVLTAYQTTNLNFVQHWFDRWSADGRKDSSYDPLWATGSGSNAHVTVLVKAPGTNGFVATVQTEPAGLGGPKATMILLLDENGVPNGGLLEAPFIDGAVNDIAFEAVHAETVAAGGYDRIIVAGEFSAVEGVPCNNLTAINKDGAVAWSFGAGEGPNGPIHAVEVQLDGKVLIGGSFTNIGSTQVNGMARLIGNSTPEAMYLYWADAEFRAFEKRGEAELVLRRGGNTNQALTVNLTITPKNDGSLADLGEFPAAVVFAAGSAEATVRLPLIDDAEREGRERFEFRVSAASDVLATRPTAELVILDNETAGTLDADFSVGTEISFGTIGLQEDGKVIIGGSGTGLVRLNRDGSVDPSFVTNGISVTTGDWSIQQILPQPDGKIYVAGRFNTSSNAYDIHHVARLNSDGTLDRSFNPMLSASVPFGPDSVKIEVLENGEVWVWLGRFMRGPNGLFNSGLFRLDRDGSLISSVSNSPNWRDVAELQRLPSGEILAYTTTIPFPGSVLKYKPSGVQDTNFVLNVSRGGGFLYDMEVAGDWLLLGGSFTEVNSTSISNLARVDIRTGALDANFNVILDGEVRAIHARDGKIYIAGNFTTVNGEDRFRVARLNSDGTLDEAFDPGLGPNSWAAYVEALPDGRVLLSTALSDHVDGVPAARLVRLHGDALPGTIRLVSRRIVVNETNGVATIEIERVGGSTGAISATLETIEGSAVSGENFLATNVTVTFLDGEYARKAIEIPISVVAGRNGDRTFAVRLNSGATVDEATVLIEDAESTFLEASAAFSDSTNAVRDVEIGANGAVYVAGDFYAVNGTSVTNLARLNSDLSLDTSFALETVPRPVTSAGDPANQLSAPIEGIAVRINGDVVFSGKFVEIGGSNWTYLAQVDAEGRYDVDFIRSNMVTFGVTTIASNLVVQPDGKLLAILGGNGILRRLNSDGTRDATFANMASGIMDLAVHPDGSIYLLRQIIGVGKMGPAGQMLSSFFATGRHIPPNRLGEGASVESIAILPDGNFLIGGDFTHVNNVFSPRLARLSTNGVVDTNFNAAVGLTVSRPNETVSAIQVLPGGDILIGGTFSEVQGVSQGRIALLDSNGVLRAEFDPVVEGGGIEEFGLLADGSILVHGNVSAVDGNEVGELFKLRLPLLLPPEVHVLWPTNGTEIHTSDVIVPFEIQVRAFDPDGFLENVVVELNGVAIATNTIGSFVLERGTPAEGEHTLTVTATDAEGLSTTETVTFRVIHHPWPGLIAVRRENDGVVIDYDSGRLQSSSDLRSWVHVHEGGGEYRAPGTETHRFFRVAL